MSDSAGDLRQIPSHSGQTAARSRKPARARGSQAKKSVPYSSATTGTKAREEISKVLRRFGCESIGFMDDFEKHEVLLAFTHRGRQVQLQASAKGWAQIYLKENPWTYQRRSTRHDYEQAALRQGHVAVNSIFKGQVTAIECGILKFEAVFMPYMLTSDGRPLIERVGDLLPEADAPKVVQIPYTPGAA
jgi:hypothetical protein